MNKIIAVFLVALCMTVCVTAYSDGVQADLQDNLIRLHIIADSDDDNDQAVKLKVRDAILKNVGDRLSKTDKNECRDEIINDLNEFEDKIILTNPGSFLPGKIEKVLDPGYNPPFYRNQLLAETMVKLNMIDSQSIGIRRVFRIQRDRYFPLPDYDLSNRQQVKVCVYGKVLDENYSQILFANPDLDLETVFLIDCVQKRIKIDKEAVKHLRKLKVIEGMSPNIFLSASVSETIGEQSQYVKNKAFNDQYYRNLIVKYLEQYGSAKKRY